MNIMKRFYLFFVSVLLFPPAVSATETDYTQGLSIWFDTPNGLDGQTVWSHGYGDRGANKDRAVHYLSETAVWAPISWVLLLLKELHSMKKHSGEADRTHPAGLSITGM